MSPPVAVLHVVTSTHRRGAETFAVDLATAMIDDGVRSEIVALGRADHGPELDIESLATRPRDPRLALALRRRAADVDVVIAHGSATLPATVAAVTFPPSKPFVYRVIGDPEYWASGQLRRLRVGLQLRRAASVAVYYADAATTVVDRFGLDPARVEVIPKGLAVDRYPAVSDEERREARRGLGLAEDDEVVAFVGALSTEKNPRLAIVAARRTPATLLVVGDGPERGTLVAEFEDDRTRFLGAVDDVRPVLAASDVVTLTSRTEGVPGALIEAGLAGRPAVTTAVGGVREVVDHGRTGFVVSADADALADAIGNAIAERTSLGAAARAHCVQHFDLARTAAAWTDLVVRTARDRRA